MVSWDAHCHLGWEASAHVWVKMIPWLWCRRGTFRWPCSCSGMGGTLLEAISYRDIWEGYGKPRFPYSVILGEMDSGYVQSTSLNLWQHKQTWAARTETTKLRVMGGSLGVENAVNILSRESGQDGFGIGLGPFNNMLCSHYNCENGWICLPSAL